MSPLLLPGTPIAFHDLRADQYPCSLLLYYADGADLMIAWAVTLLAPEAGEKALVKIPPARHWVGHRVDAAIIPAREPWPPNLKLAK